MDLSLRLLTARQAQAMAERLPPSSTGRALLLDWVRPAGALSPVSSVWIEIDLDHEPTITLDPILCAKLSPATDSDWLLGTLLPALLGSSPPAGQLGRIRGALAALPASAYLLYLFSLRARGSAAIRLEIFGMAASQILTYLQVLAPDRVPDVARAASLLKGAERLHLSFDVAEGILPRIGLEGSFPRQPPREPRWRSLLERLVEEGLCSPDKRDALLDWPGYDSFWTAPDRWPAAEAGSRGFCARALSHLKLVCQPGLEPEAKAYLALDPLNGSGTLGSTARASASFT